MSNNLNLARLSNILADIKSRRDSDIASKVSETVFAAHVNDDDSHITNSERISWTSKAEGIHTHSSADIPELRDLISTTNTNYNDLSAEIANHTTQIASLGSSVSAIDQTVSGHTTELAALTTQVASLGSNISDINDDIYNINQTIPGHTTQIASLGSSISDINDDIYNINEAISTINNNYNDLSATLTALAAKVAENIANIETLLEDTAEIDETTINNLLTDVFGE